jgi:diaminopimelate decarboxylase
MAFVARVNFELGTSLGEVNLGGGIPSTSLRRATALDLLLNRQPGSLPDSPSARLEAFCRRLSEIFVQAGQRAGLAKAPRLAAEPGRSVVGNAGVLITRVRAIKGHWAFLDASRNYLAESPLFIKRGVMSAARPLAQSTRSYHLSGATLNTTDVIDFRRRLPALQEGDVLALGDAGAYSLARASRYAGLAPAAYLVGEDGGVRLIRPAETVRELSRARMLL